MTSRRWTLFMNHASPWTANADAPASRLGHSCSIATPPQLFPALKTARHCHIAAGTLERSALVQGTRDRQPRGTLVAGVGPSPGAHRF